MKGLAGERWTYTASGMVTVLAARIGALSGETRLYIGPQTYERIQSRFECVFIGGHEMHNVKEPVAVYRVMKAKN